MLDLLDDASMQPQSAGIILFYLMVVVFYAVMIGSAQEAR